MCPGPQKLEEVLNKYPQRVDLIKSLHHLLAYRDSSFLLINGHNSTGKTSITRDIIQAIAAHFSWTDCYEIDSTLGMEKKINIDLFPSMEEKSPRKKQLSISHFTDQFSSMDSPSRFYIVLDNFDSLIRKKIDVLPTLHEISNHLRRSQPNSSLMVILITSQKYDRFIPHFLGVSRPSFFSFPQLDEQRLSDVIYSLLHGKRRDGEKQTLKNQIDFMVGAVCTSFYDIPKLYRMVKKASKDSTYNTLNEFWKYNAEKCVASVIRPKSVEFSIRYLPTSMKYLMIACFIASNNSKASDKRFLVVRSDKRKISRRKPTVSSELRLFTLERLIHIYQAIITLNSCKYVNDLTCITNSWFHQLEYLVQLKLLVKMPSISIPFPSSLTKYKISDYLTPDLIMKISENLNFPVKNYLEAFR